MGRKWSQECFFKSDPRPFGMLKQVFLAHSQPVLMRFGPWKIPKFLEKGPFWKQKFEENGSKMRFAKSDPAPLGLHKIGEIRPFGAYIDWI